MFFWHWHKANPVLVLDSLLRALYLLGDLERRGTFWALGTRTSALIINSDVESRTLSHYRFGEA
jgi:hypothetical protein